MRERHGEVQLRVHAILPVSEANGPGKRFVLWLQGCPIHCDGCSNPDTHDPNGGYCLDVGSLVEVIVQSSWKGEIGGLTISGGEPLIQGDALLELLSRLRHSAACDLSIILFTGYYPYERRYTFAELITSQLVDVIVAGPYVRGLGRGFGLCSTENQSMIYVTRRLGYHSFFDLPEAEVVIHPDKIVETGTFTGKRP